MSEDKKPLAQEEPVAETKGGSSKPPKENGEVSVQGGSSKPPKENGDG